MKEASFNDHAARDQLSCLVGMDVEVVMSLI